MGAPTRSYPQIHVRGRRNLRLRRPRERCRTHTGSTARSGPEHGVQAVAGQRDRDYDPTTGTFLSPDPLDGIDGTPTVANRYHYADNDPLNKTDPLGLMPGDPDFTFASTGGSGCDRLIDVLACPDHVERLRPDRVVTLAQYRPQREIHNFIEQFEEFRSSAYDDGLGNCTIGIGTLLPDLAPPCQGHPRVSHRWAKMRNTEHIVNEILPSLMGFFGGDFAAPVHQWDALISFAYSEGTGGLMRKLCQSCLGEFRDNGNSEGVASAIESYRTNPDKSHRRTLEARLFRTGECGFCLDAAHCPYANCPRVPYEIDAAENRGATVYSGGDPCRPDIREAS